MRVARRGRSLLQVLTLSASVLGTTGVTAQKPAPGLTCGVEGSTQGVRSTELCGALGRELRRTITMVDDARTAQGEAVQIIRGDVQWTVIWLADGHVRAWTRVSQAEAAKDQVRFVVNATKALVKAGATVTKTAPTSDCVRLDPSGRQTRSIDLVYPWAELEHCRRKVVEVVDPWWVPASAP